MLARVMEYLPLSLTQCLEREELPLQMKYSILVDVAKGLCYLHGKRPPIVHRDLTANNVLLTSSYSAKISDLGVSRLADTFKKHHLTTAPGNAMVMPPEALKDNPVYDHKLDVFSYGCLILHVLTGQFPQPTNQFVQEPGKEKLFKKVSEWDRRSSYIKDIPKENELLALARGCLNDAPTGRPEMIESYRFVEQVLSKCPKIKSTTEFMKENEAAKNHIHDLDAENKVLKSEKDKLEKRLTADYKRLTADHKQLGEDHKVLRADYHQLTTDHKHLRSNYECMTADYQQLRTDREQLVGDLRKNSSQVTGLQNVLSLKEKEFNDCTEVLKETIRSREEQIVKQQQDNKGLLKKRESEMKEEYEAKLQTLTNNYEHQLSKAHEECESRVLEVMKEFTVKSSEALNIPVVSIKEITSSLQSLALADIPSYQAQKELIHPLLTQCLNKGDKWLV